jgi:hypothetical protein
VSDARIRSEADFLAVLSRLRVAANPEHVASDMEALRLAFPNEAAHLRALQSVLEELAHAVARASTWGIGMTGPYTGWRRSSCQSHRARGSPADLRIVFRPMVDGRVELRAFGHRWLPETVHFRARNR